MPIFKQFNPTRFTHPHLKGGVGLAIKKRHRRGGAPTGAGHRITRITRITQQPPPRRCIRKDHRGGLGRPPLTAA